nr:retrovirus-related Pol polyprotein from transposon TNT 1-94 [Tanacetum cinerariifolium]
MQMLKLVKDWSVRDMKAMGDVAFKNQGDVNDVMGLKKKTVVVTSDPLALIAEKMKVSKRKEKVVVFLDSEGSDEDDFSELKKITALLAKAFNRRKFYSKPTNNNFLTSSASQSANKKQEYVKSDDKQVEKKDDEKKRDMSKVKCYNCKKEGHFAKDCKKAKVNDYEYYKTKMLLTKKDKDEQVLLAEDHAWMESRSDSDQEINANMVFMAQIEKVLSDSEASSSSTDDKIPEVLYYLSESESEYEYETSEYYDNTTTYDLRPTLYDERVINLGYTLMFLTYSAEALEIKKFKRARENKIEFAYDYGNPNASYVNEKINLSDDYFQEIINPDFDKIDSPFQQTSSLKPYVPTVILEKIIIDLEDGVVSLLKKEKANLATIESLKSKCFESSENVVSETKNKSENDCQVIEKVCDSKENPTVIAPRIFKLNVSQSVSPISVTKTSCASNNVETKLKRKRRKRTSSKQNDKQVNNDVLRANRDFVHFSDLDTLSLGHNLFSVGQFCDKGLEVAFRKSTCFVRTEDGVDLLTGDRSLNLYTIALNEVASNSSACLLEKASSSQSWLWNQRLSHLNFATINNLVKNNLVQGLPKMKFEKDHLCSACEQGKIHRKHHKSKMAFASNQPLYLLHMDLCGPMRVESINGKRYVLVVVDDYSRYTWVFFLHSKDEASEVIISFIKKTQVNLQL